MRASCGEKKAHTRREETLVPRDRRWDGALDRGRGITVEPRPAWRAPDLGRVLRSIASDRKPATVTGTLPDESTPGRQSVSPDSRCLGHRGESLTSTCAERARLKVMTEIDACRKKTRSIVEVRILLGALAWCGRTRKDRFLPLRGSGLPHQVPMPR